jgi:hypothetical protein
MKFYREAYLRIKIRNKDFNGYIQTIFIKNLRISFSILKSLAWSTNTANIKVWNLSNDNRNLIKDYGDEVTLYAGYRTVSGPQLLFIGDTTAVSHIYDQPEIVTVLECGDGEKYLNQLRVNLSYSEKVKARTVLEQIAKQMNLPIAEISISDDLEYRNGYSFNNMGKDALNEVCAYLGLQWSVQNGALQVIPLNGTITQPTIEINEMTGMQGIPQRFTYKRLDLYRAVTAPTTGYQVASSLNPLLLPGGKINLQSSHLGIKGIYRMENVRHQGDTYGFDWRSGLEVTEVTS